MDELFDHPIDSSALQECLDRRLETAASLLESLLHVVTPEEFDQEFDAWDAELGHLGDDMADLVDDVADEVEDKMDAGEPTCLAGTLALRLMEVSRAALALPEDDREIDSRQFGLDLNVFICGWQFLKALESRDLPTEPEN